MTASISTRYSFAERVFDATHDEHDECMGEGRVAVIVADYHLTTITVWHFATSDLARQWRADDDDGQPDIEYYTVGGDIK